MPLISNLAPKRGSVALAKAMYRGLNLLGSAPADPLAPILSILRSVGGLLYMPGLDNRGASDGTGPTPAPGDPIGFAEEMAAGTNDATQPITSSRPILRRSGGGYYWEFDGSNDALRLNTIPATWGQDLIVMAVGGRGFDGTTAKLYEQLPASGSGAIVLRLSSGGSVAQAIDAAGGTRTTAVGTAPVGEEVVAELEILSGVVRSYNNGVASSTGSIPTGAAPVFASARLGSISSTTASIQGPTIILPGAAATNITTQARQTLRQWLLDYRDSLNGL